jgi:hypothetical protein
MVPYWRCQSASSCRPAAVAASSVLYILDSLKVPCTSSSTRPLRTAGCASSTQVPMPLVPACQRFMPWPGVSQSSRSSSLAVTALRPKSLKRNVSTTFCDCKGYAR